MADVCATCVVICCEGCLIEWSQTRNAFRSYGSNCLPASWRTTAEGYEAIEEDAPTAPPKARKVLGLPQDRRQPESTRPMANPTDEADISP